MRARTLDALSAALGPVPRRWSWRHGRALLPRGEAWMSDDPLGEQLYRADELLERGQVRWAALVQANATLWEAGSGSRPALLLIDRQGACADQAWVLRDYASQLFGLRERRPETPQEEQVARLLRDEMARGALRVPPELVGGHELELRTALVTHAHLPGLHIQDRLLPVLVLDGVEAVHPVPVEFWPPRLRLNWRNSADDAGGAPLPWNWISVAILALIVAGAIARLAYAT